MVIGKSSDKFCIQDIDMMYDACILLATKSLKMIPRLVLTNNQF